MKSLLQQYIKSSWSILLHFSVFPCFHRDPINMGVEGRSSTQHSILEILQTKFFKTFFLIQRDFLICCDFLTNSRYLYFYYIIFKHHILEMSFFVNRTNINWQNFSRYTLSKDDISKSFFNSHIYWELL